MKIEQSQSKLSLNEIQIATAILWLKHPYLNATGGKQLAEWLNGNQESVLEVFGADDRLYIKTKDKETNTKLVKFLLENKVADKLEWKKFTSDDRWWLLVWWDFDEETNEKSPKI